MRLLPLLLAVPLLAGCLAPAAEPPAEPGPAPAWLEGAAWDTTALLSQPLAKGPYAVLPPELATVQGVGGTPIATAVWRPDVPNGTRVPVLLEAGPYWPMDLRTGGLIDNDAWVDRFVPHGYAYARVAVRGTSASGGCMEFMSLREQQDLGAVLDHFGAAPWSSGRVGMVGKSYDGTTPWMAAALGNRHLATVVPIAGITDVGHWMYPNGTYRAYGAETHANYWLSDGFGLTTGFGAGDVGRPPRWPDQLCPETLRGLAEAEARVASGEAGAVDAAYWSDRALQERVLANYNGSAFLVHGFHDPVVPASQALPFAAELAAKGNRVKLLLGQWAHDYPDSKGLDAKTARRDHAEVLLRWLDRELKGLPVDTGPAIDVQDSALAWRTEAAWPPGDARPWRLDLGAGTLANGTQPAGSVTVAGVGGLNTPAAGQAFTLAPGHPPLRIAGLPTLRLPATSADPRASLTAYLSAVAPDGASIRLSTGSRCLCEPGDALRFEPTDAVVPPSHALRLVVYPNVPGVLVTRPPTPVTLQWGDGAAWLALPLVERDAGAGTYPGQPA